MKNLIFIIVLITIVFFGCRKTNNSLTPAQTISGTYQAITYQSGFETQMNYPIDGQTIYLQISPLSTDSVNAWVVSTPNYYYSPGNDITYSNLAVTKYICTNCQYTVSYSIELAPNPFPGSNTNSIFFLPGSENSVYYTYIPPGYTKGAVQTIFSKTK